LPGDPGAHGRFDDRSRSFSWQFQVTKHRALTIAGVAAVAGLLWAARRRRP
jgi:hypothetical protein